MRTRDLLGKLAAGLKLDPLELEQLNQFADRSDEISTLVSHWTVPSSQAADFKNPRIVNPIWGTDPLHTLYVERHTNVSITSGVDLEVTFETQFGENNVFALDTDFKKVLCKVKNMPFNVNGIVGFAANATGYRNAKLSAYDKDDVLIGTAVVFAFPGFTGNDNVFPFSYPVTAAQQFDVSYFKMTVGQTSGAGLNLLFFDMGVSIG